MTRKTHPVAIALTWLCLAVTLPAADLYVATNGLNNTSPGRGQSLAAPYLTIDYAADRATPGDTIHIRGGTYRETISPGVSGTVGNPIVFKPYEGETVIVSGLNRIVENTNGAGAWTVDSGNIHRIDLTSSYGTDFYRKQASQQVFVNGALMGEARWPNSPTANPIDFDRLNMAAADSGTLAAAPTTGTRDATYTDSDFSGFATDAWAGALLVFNPGYGWFSRSSESVTGNLGTTLNFRFNPFSGSHRAIPSNGDPYMLMGKRVALDAPGEAYFDDSGRDGTQFRLYLYQPGGGSPAANEIEMRRRTKGIDVVDRSHLRFENITVRAANIETTTGSSNCTFDGMNVEYGASVWQEFRFMFPCYLRGTGHRFLNGRITGSLDDGIRAEGSGHLIRNNVVSDCLRAGINLADKVPNVDMEQNTAHTLGSGSFGANAAPGKVVYNHGYLNGLFATDFSVIGTLGPSDGQNSEWAYNWAHDNLAVRDDNGPGFDRNWFGGSAIRLDYGAGNYLIHHNITWNTTQDEGFAVWAIQSTGPNYLDAKIRLYNNTTDREIGIVETYGSAASAKGIDLRNNLCGEGFFIRSSGTDATGRLYQNDVILRNNLFPNIGIPNNPTPPHAANRQGATGWVDGNSRPLGYQLLPGSQAIDNGTVIPGITDGFQGAAPDIGALESGVRPFIAGALVRPQDVSALTVAQQGLGFVVSGLPPGRSLPTPARVRIGAAASSNDFTPAYEFVNHTVTATFNAPSVPGAGQAVQISLDGTTFTTLPGTIDVTGPGDENPPAGVVRARFTDGEGTIYPQQFTGTTGAGWVAAWVRSTQTSTSAPTAPLLPGTGTNLRVARTGGSGSGLEGVYRQWSATTRPPTSFSRLTFSVRLDSTTGVFNNATDNLTFTARPIPGATSGPESTFFIRTFGGATGSLLTREWGVYHGDGISANSGYNAARLVPTGLICQPGTTYTFTIDLYGAAGAGTTSGKAHGTYDVTITDGTTTRTVLGSRFRSAAYSTGDYLSFSAGQNLTTDNLAFSVDSIEIAPLTIDPPNLPPAAAAGPDRTVTLPATANLSGTAMDDGLPAVPGTLMTTWSRMSGPGTVVFGDPAVAATTAAFSAAGNHVLRLTVNDGLLTTFDEMTVTVSPAATVTALASDANPQPVGAAITFTGTVTSGFGTPGGTVTFFDGATSLGSATLNPSGVATFSTSTLAVGSYPITAVFTASGNHASSISTVLNMTVTSLYDTWLMAHFSPLDLANPALETSLWGNLADPDSDTFVNLMEYALATDPRLPSPGPVAGREPDGRLKLTFQRIADPTLVYQVLGSDNLLAWPAVWTSGGAQNVAGSVTVIDTEPFAPGKRFLRLSVVQP